MSAGSWRSMPNKTLLFPPLVVSASMLATPARTPPFKNLRERQEAPVASSVSWVGKGGPELTNAHDSYSAVPTRQATAWARRNTCCAKKVTPRAAFAHPTHSSFCDTVAHTTPSQLTATVAPARFNSSRDHKKVLPVMAVNQGNSSSLRNSSSTTVKRGGR